MTKNSNLVLIRQNKLFLQTHMNHGRLKGYGNTNYALSNIYWASSEFLLQYSWMLSSCWNLGLLLLLVLPTSDWTTQLICLFLVLSVQQAWILKTKQKQKNCPRSLAIVIEKTATNPFHLGLKCPRQWTTPKCLNSSRALRAIKTGKYEFPLLL